MKNLDKVLHAKAVETKAALKSFFESVKALIPKLESVVSTSPDFQKKIYDGIKDFDQFRQGFDFTSQRIEEDVISDADILLKKTDQFRDFLILSDDFLKRVNDKDPNYKLVRLFVDAAKNDLGRLVALLRQLELLVNNKLETSGEKKKISSPKKGSAPSENLKASNNIDSFSEEILDEPEDLGAEQQLLSLIPLDSLAKYRQLEKIEYEKTRDWVDAVFAKHNITPDLQGYIAYRKKKLSLASFFQLKPPPSPDVVDSLVISAFSEPLVELLGKAKRLHNILSRDTHTPLEQMQIVKITRRVLTQLKDLLPNGNEVFISKKGVLPVYDNLYRVFDLWAKVIQAISLNYRKMSSAKYQLDFLKKYVNTLKERYDVYNSQLR